MNATVHDRLIPSSFMQAIIRKILAVVGLTACWLEGRIEAQTNFDVTNIGFQYFINGANNTGTSPGGAFAPPTNNCPPIFVTAGTTNTFTITVASPHPVEIVTNSPGPTATHFTGATPTTVTSGTMTLVIPATNYPSTLFYECSQHFFYGVINVLPPVAQAPPQNHIFSIVVGATTVTIVSDGTSTTYNFVPEFNSNLAGGTWQSVPNFTNVFANGTNTTTFNRLDAICGSNVFLRVSQRPPP